MTLGGSGGARDGGARRPPAQDVLAPAADGVGGTGWALVGCCLPPTPIFCLKGLERASLPPSDESADSSLSSPLFRLAAAGL